MANSCEFNLRVSGGKQQVLNFFETMKKRKEYEFITDISRYEYYDPVKYINCDFFGVCKWSVADAMLGKDSIQLDKISKELSLVIEIYGIETGNGFAEHYIFAFGETIEEQTVECEETDDGRIVGGFPTFYPKKLSYNEYSYLGGLYGKY